MNIQLTSNAVRSEPYFPVSPYTFRFVSLIRVRQFTSSVALALLLGSLAGECPELSPAVFLLCTLFFPTPRILARRVIRSAGDRAAHGGGHRARRRKAGRPNGIRAANVFLPAPLAAVRRNCGPTRTANII